MKYRVVLGLALVLSLLSGLLPFYDARDVPDNLTGELRVMNFNTHFGVELNKGYGLTGFADQVKLVNPHVVAFEEVTVNSPLNGFANMQGDFMVLMDELGYSHAYVNEGQRSQLRNAIFSKIPFESARTIYYEENNIFIRSFLDIRIEFENIEYVILATHLTHLPSPDSETEFETGEVRLTQISQLVEYAENLGSNVIMMGDFNFLPTSEEYDMAVTYFTDGWDATHPGEPGYSFPAAEDEDTFNRRIDYIFLSPSVTASDCSIYETTVSDHKPISCDVLGI